MQTRTSRSPQVLAPRGPGAPPAVPAAPLADQALSEIWTALDSSPSGLAQAVAVARATRVGPNEINPTHRPHLLIEILQFFGNPLVLILLAAAGTSALVGETASAVIIVVMVLLSVALNFVQTYRSQQAADRLRAQVAPTALVRRDGVWAECPRSALVPGDLIQLAAGALVPADARLVTAADLHVQEAALTGESLPVAKAVRLEAAQPAGLGADSGSVFLGTAVVSGTATAVVTATGPATAFGAIAAGLARRAPETEFDRGTRRFGLLIMRTVVFLVLFVFLISIMLHHNQLESLLFAVALAVGLTPEFLPMITTVTLSRGAVHMARQQVIVKHLAAIQNFGSIDILCSDKTGTLTAGVMVLEGHTDLDGAPAERVFLLAYLNSFHATGIPNAADSAILQKAASSPLDQAILAHDHLDVRSYEKIAELPFDFERRRMSVVVAAGPQRWLITKGAPESVLPHCTTREQGTTAQPLDDAGRARGTARYEALNAEGLRVLAVAFRTVPLQDHYSAADEQDLVLAGFLTFSDPPLPDTAAALQALAADGVQVKIITGDNEQVARHVCGQVGLDVTRVVGGSELDQISDAALGAVAEQTAIFARVSPAQKNRIILALKSRGHVVGYLGDGINDAPSLHAADVGISVAGGVEVARDAADIILLAPGLRVLHQGIMEGRKAFGNVMKYLLMGTSSNFGNMFSMAVAFLFLPFLPMLPMQILLNNFLYDLAQVTIPTDHVDATFIHKPHRWDIRLIRDFMLYIGPISSIYDFLTFGALLWLFGATEAMFHTGWFVESLITQTLVLFVIRTAGNPLHSRPSTPLAVTVLLVVAVALGLPFSPLAGVLGFTPLPPAYFAFLVVVVGTYLLLVEAIKRRLMGRMLV